MAWFGPKGVASMLFALFVLKSDVADGNLIFDIAVHVADDFFAVGKRIPIGHSLVFGGERTAE